MSNGGLRKPQGNFPTANGVTYRHKVPRFEQPPVLFDIDDSQSVIRVVSEHTKEQILRAQASHPQLFDLDERDLKDTLRQKSIFIGKVDNCLRIKFWIEYERAASTRTRFNDANVYTGICTKAYFKDRYMNTAEKVAWVLTPPLDYETSLLEALDFGNEQMRDILDLPHIDPDTKKIDHKLLEIKMKIRNTVESRLLGGIVQKSENLLAVTDFSKEKRFMEEMTEEEIDRKIKTYESTEYVVEQPASDEEIKDILTEQAEKIAVERKTIAPGQS